MIYEAKEGQTPLDVTVQFYGSLNYLFTLLDDNNLVATVALGEGDEVEIRDELVVDEELPVIANQFDEI